MFNKPANSSAQKIKKNSEFLPSLPKGLFNPFYTIRRSILKAIKAKSSFVTGKVLDYGCGSKPYYQLFETSSYIGVDILNPGHSHESENVDVYFDGINLPFEDSSFDNCFSSEVFEHVFEIDKVIREIHRVLKVGGKVIATTPFVWDEHEVPNDFCRYTSFGIKAVFERNGFEITSINKYGTFLETINQLTLLYFYYLTRKSRLTRAIFKLIVTPFMNICSAMTRFFPRASETLFLGQIIVAEKKQ